MSAETARILRKAKARLQGQWCQGASACTRDGVPISPSERHGRDLDACNVCAIGAVRWALSGDPLALRRDDYGPFDEAIDALDRAARSLSSEWHLVIETFNDHRTEAEVRAAFDLAIAAQEASA